MLNDRLYRYHYEILWHHGAVSGVAVEPIFFAYSPVRVVNYAIERKTSTFYWLPIGLMIVAICPLQLIRSMQMMWSTMVVVSTMAAATDIVVLAIDLVVAVHFVRCVVDGTVDGVRRPLASLQFSLDLLFLLWFDLRVLTICVLVHPFCWVHLNLSVFVVYSLYVEF